MGLFNNPRILRDGAAMKSNPDHIAREVERLTQTIATLKPRSERRAVLMASLIAYRVKQLKIETRSKKQAEKRG